MLTFPMNKIKKYFKINLYLSNLQQNFFKTIFFSIKALIFNLLEI